MPKTDVRIPTGVPGFDALVQGGFVPRSANLVYGGPGSGKTTFGLQFLLSGAMQYGEKGLYISFEETLRSIIENADAMGWDFKSLVDSGKVDFLYLNVYDSWKNLAKKVYKYIQVSGAKRVVIDSLSVYTLAVHDPFYARKSVYQLINLLKTLECTSFAVAEEETGDGENKAVKNNLDYLFDSVVKLHNAGLGGESDMALQIVKMRRTNHGRGPREMKIVTGKGVVVNPKV
ncbi:hypothetical protein HZB02_02955 [Candidatus Woesearchaeota archaeon]|nr:hypothetical protein [Candidatus Woesearchaeota archaeon]